MEQPITYIGLDVHKETIAVALADAGKWSEVRDYGTIANTPTALKALTNRLAKPGAVLRFCYEAGPCGYECVVVAPSLVPRKPGAEQDRPAGCDQPRQATSGR